MTIGAQFKVARLLLGWTQSELAWTERDRERLCRTRAAHAAHLPGSPPIRAALESARRHLRRGERRRAGRAEGKVTLQPLRAARAA